MRFTIITTKPGHQPPQTRCDFNPPGGTIGRGTDNNLVLPDNDRVISRLQAIVHIAADGTCRITNRGNVTRVVLNDIPLERGRQVELQDGDTLDIDEYRLQVNDLTQTPNVPQRSAGASAPRQAQGDAPAAENAPAAVPTEIWDSLMQEFSISDSISSTRPKPQDAPPFNPFNEAKETERNPENPLAHFNTQEPLFEEPSVATDTLFSNDELFKNASIFNDATPTALTPPPYQPARQAQPEDELDPLALFGDAGSGVMQTAGDDPLGLMGNAAPLTPLDAAVSPFGAQGDVAQDQPAAPEGENAPPPAEEDAPPAHSPVDGSPLFADEAFHPEPYAPYAGITLPTPQAVARSASPAPKGRLRIDPVPTSAPQNSAAHPSSGGDVLQGELLDALLEGMGLSDMQPAPQFDRENLRQLGQMLGMFSQGTVALLSSRSILKRGVKADMTMVLDDANNPFKLLPSGKTVLMQMFGTRMPGFMPPQKSVRDALIDLQAHQLGMISGIRAIIAAMLQSFNPEQLEEEAKRDGATSRLALPSGRKAALWDYFVRCYNNTAGEIEDDFHTLFGEAFLHAYDMEVNQYKDSQSGSETS